MANDNLINQNTTAWRVQVWTFFVISFVGMIAGIFYLPADAWVKGFLAICYISSVSASFTLSKTVRDDHEAERLINRVTSAKTEKILTTFES